jgi:tetratricopeptide (TPR) repeat protein
MQNDVIPKDDQSLIVRPEPMRLVFAEGMGDQIALVLPPLEDLAEIDKVTDKHFSLRAHADDQWLPFKSAFAAEFAQLEKKKVRFGHSKTFITHLANLAELAGKREAEYDVLVDKPEELRDPFMQRLIAENLIARGRSGDAEKILLALDLANDAAASLRIAFFLVQRNDLDEAERVVSRVLATDPFNYGGRLFEGALRLSKGQFHQAIQSFRIAEEERPTSSVLFTNIAIAYICAKNNDKALATLRKAVALDPLNQNAVSLLADVSHVVGCDEDAVPALRYFVSLEQRSPSIWGRLARALLEIQRPQEALDALRRQASQEDTAAVWNNIGVARVACKRRSEALSAFQHAIQKVTGDTRADGLLALRNTLALLVEEQHYDEVIRFAGIALTDDPDHLCRRDKKLCDIYVFMLHAMHHINRTQEAMRICEELLKDESIAYDLRIWVITQMLAQYAITPEQADRAVALAREYIGALEHLDVVSDRLHEGFINNVVFTFAETGRVDEAQALLSHMSNLVHHLPYPTATLGLLHFRKGNIERGVALYEEAIRLSTQSRDKTRIRQKLNLELGLFLLAKEPRRAERLLRKADSERDGSPELKHLAQVALRRLPSRTAGQLLD